ncbi:DUF6555 family protein [Pseudomonas sp. G.S.17]|uniref:DUF6555 family protein n=1 Tax=Pseudomonas sp. G.S.17 TaxID=3137451 RepID=UPI00311C9175
MAQDNHYRIDYLLQGLYRTFYIRAETMSHAEAWYWATVDAGLGQIPKYRNDKSPKLSKPQAESLGLTSVEWSLA